jgi:DNA polymerase
MTPDVWFRAGQHLAYKRKGSWIFCRLPSGRVLCYISPKITDDEITYSCMDQTSHKWVRAKVYAGKFVAHATQASARDLLFQNMLKAKNNGYNCVMRVHDELICEVPDVEKYNATELGQIIATPLPWCSDIPLAAAGYETNLRYKKD